MSDETEVIEVRTTSLVHLELARIAAVAGVTLDEVCRVALATWLLRPQYGGSGDQEHSEEKAQEQEAAK